MFGNTRADSSAHGTAGIIPNAVKELFDQIAREELTLATGESWLVQAGYMEVYNDQVYDLLSNKGKTLAVQEDPARGTVIAAGLTEFSVHSYEDVLDILMQGNQARKTESTMANVVSSRSHAILQITVKHVTREMDTGKELLVESKLSLIDLAGSERASATNNKGIRLVEGGQINKSLLALGNVINALSQRSAMENSSSGNSEGGGGGGAGLQRNPSGQVPPTPKGSRAGGGSGFTNVKYRDSKLTHLLKGSLEGNCNIVMIANINPSHSTYDDSYHTLAYAYRAKTIKVNPQVMSRKETFFALFIAIVDLYFSMNGFAFTAYMLSSITAASSSASSSSDQGSIPGSQSAGARTSAKTGEPGSALTHL